MGHLTRLATLLHRPHEHDGAACDSALQHVARTEGDEWVATCTRTGLDVTWRHP